MAKAAATLLVLLSYLRSKVQTDTDILRCNFTVKTRSIPKEFTPQCSVNEVPLHLYDNDNTRNMGNTPQECADLFPKLKDTEEELMEQLLTMEIKGNLTRGDHSLLVTMVSLYEEGQPIYAYWNFTLDEQYSFTVKIMNNIWRVIHNNTPDIDKWLNNTKLAKHLQTLSIGDSGRCFKKFLSHGEKMPRPTSRTPDIGNVTSPSELPSTKQPPSKEGSSVTVIYIVIAIAFAFPFAFVTIIVMFMKRKSHPQGGKQHSGFS
ncbi:Retinoic acid early-inducible protein 1-alpha, partial [Lemmus lemmus]